MTFERRNSSVCCYIDPSYERSVSNVSCPCTRDDYVWSVRTTLLDTFCVIFSRIRTSVVRIQPVLVSVRTVW